MKIPAEASLNHFFWLNYSRLPEWLKNDPALVGKKRQDVNLPDVLSFVQAICSMNCATNAALVPCKKLKAGELLCWQFPRYRERTDNSEETIVWETPVGIKSCSFRNRRLCSKRSHCFNISQHSQLHGLCARKQHSELWRRTLDSWKFIMSNSVMTKGRTQKHFLGGGENRDSIWRAVFLDERVVLFTFLY